MAALYMLRTPGRQDFPGFQHLLEGRVVDNVSKEDAARFIEAGIAEEFDSGNELHATAADEFDHLDAKRGAPVAMKAATREKVTDYETMTVEELHAEAAKRNIEGRSALTTKELLIKAIEKDDKGKAKK